VWFGGTNRLQPFVWYYKWPDAVKQQLCTDQNKDGTITISDLELLGILMHWITLEHAVGKNNIKHTSPAIWCDNLAAVIWIHKFRNNTSTIATNILRALATRLHHSEAGLLNVDHISGIFNILADTASRKHTTNNTQFLNSFNTLYPPPQNNSWNLYQFNTKLTSKICSKLLLKTSPMESFRRLPEKGFVFLTNGQNGLVNISEQYHPHLKNSKHQQESNYWQPTEHMLETAAFHLANTKLVLKQSRWRFEPSARQCNWKANLIPWQTRKINIQKRLANYWRDTNEPTHQQNQN